jgi:hypothetical protein
LEIEPTPPGTSVIIPSAFARSEPAPAPDGTPAIALFDPQTREPVERTGETDAWVRFELPPQVVPLDLEEVTVSFAVKGAVGTVELLGRSGDRTESLHVWRSPAGALQVKVRRRDVLGLDDRGGIRLGFRVRGSERPVEKSPGRAALARYWQIDSVRVEASGRTREAPPATDRSQ